MPQHSNQDITETVERVLKARNQQRSDINRVAYDAASHAMHDYGYDEGWTEDAGMGSIYRERIPRRRQHLAWESNDGRNEPSYEHVMHNPYLPPMNVITGMYESNDGMYRRDMPMYGPELMHWSSPPVGKRGSRPYGESNDGMHRMDAPWGAPNV